MIIVPAVGLLGLAFGLSEFLLNVFKHSRRHDSGTDAGSLPLIWIVILVSMLIGLLLTRYVPSAALATGPGLYVAGFTIFGIGALLRWYSIFYLGHRLCHLRWQCAFNGGDSAPHVLRVPVSDTR